MNSISQAMFFLTVLCASASTAAQTCQPHIRATAPDSRYTVDAAQGTVLDTKTGLMWKRCAEGQSGTDCSTGTVATYTWGQALSRAAGSAYAGYTDWRLPNIKELRSLVEEKCYHPAINLTVFPNATFLNKHWSSSSNASYSDLAWFVHFNSGNSYNDYRDYRSAVRLVRGGQ